VKPIPVIFREHGYATFNQGKDDYEWDNLAELPEHEKTKAALRARLDAMIYKH